MEIKTAFSSQFNHDAAIRGFWCAKHVFYSSLQTENWTKKRECADGYVSEKKFDISVFAHLILYIFF